MKTIIIMLLIGTCLLTSCYYDREDELYPQNGNCDTTGVTFSSTVVPLLQSNTCLSCHSGPSPSGSISFESYNSVRTVALNGKLFGVISHSAGFSPMPQGGTKMSTCSINRIKAWIDAGAPNN